MEELYLDRAWRRNSLKRTIPPCTAPQEYLCEWLFDRAWCRIWVNRILPPCKCPTVGSPSVCFSNKLLFNRAWHRIWLKRGVLPVQLNPSPSFLKWSITSVPSNCFPGDLWSGKGCRKAKLKAENVEISTEAKLTSSHCSNLKPWLYN